ncbi:MAG: hypothetical protein ACRCYZ_06790 [Alphaproteobacteria bacterium]
MARITINTQILDGNLGDGWDDNYAAARRLAAPTTITINATEIDVSNYTDETLQGFAKYMTDEETYLCELADATPAEWVENMARTLGDARALEIIRA